MEPLGIMHCIVHIARDFVQCQETLHVGESLTSGWTLRIVNAASGRTDYVQGTGTAIDVIGFGFEPGQVYIFSVPNSTFKPYSDEATIGNTEVYAIYGKAVKGFDDSGDIYIPQEQWIILPQ